MRSKKLVRFAIIALTIVGSFISGRSWALPLSLTYQVTPSGGGLFSYSFQLKLTNADNSWVAGQGWDWIIFGDCSGGSPGCASNSGLLTGWVGGAITGPYPGFGSSSGGHNGPTFISPSLDWVPSAVGDEIDWTGTSTANLGQGSLLWSTLIFDNGAAPANFEVASLTASVDPADVPEPASAVLLATALAAVHLLRRRNSN